MQLELEVGMYIFLTSVFYNFTDVLIPIFPSSSLHIFYDSIFWYVRFGVEMTGGYRNN